MQLRSRVTKPGFFANEDLALIEPIPWPRDLFHGLWSLADREGRLEDRPMRIQIHIFPYYHKQASPEMISEWLDALQKNDLLTRYEVNGTKYIQIHNFKKHQPIHHKESESEIPEVPESYMLPQASSKHGHAQAKQDGAWPKHIGRGKSKERGRGKSKERDRGKNKEHIPYQQIIEDLTQRAGKKFPLPLAESHKKHIRARWNELSGTDEERLAVFLHVNTVKTLEWQNDKKMKTFLRPKTLYNSENFFNYAGEPLTDESLQQFSPAAQRTIKNIRQVIAEGKEISDVTD
jgi:uncharacterized phage protein (TIGR02220 family)